MGNTPRMGTERARLILVVVLTTAACFFTYYFHVILGSGTVVTHFYYVPIILACLWWKRRGLVVPLFLAAFLISSHLFLRSYDLTLSDYFRAPMFVMIALVVVVLGERLTKADEALQRSYDELERRVEERTAQLAAANQELKQEIEQRRRAEDRLELAAVELEYRNEEIKRFAYTVSHDLRAPLINLKGFAAELRSAMEAMGPAMAAGLPHLNDKERTAVTAAVQDVPEALGFIDSSVRRMDSFVNAVLVLSRLGRRELKLELIDMNAVVRETLKTLAHQIESKQIRVTVESLPEVIADRVSMQQIMGNLISNAVSYLDPGRPGEIQITGETGPDQTTFHIRDNGRGIAEQDMDKVFAPFRRAGKQDVPGEGMGLSYAQTLITRHGGHITCKSEQRVGSTFSFTISNQLMEGREDHA